MSNPSLLSLPLAEWQDTLTTVHMWSQVVGKIALAKTPLVNHFWNATLRVTPRGLRTLPLVDGSGAFAMEFDFIDHELRINCDSGEIRKVSEAGHARQNLLRITGVLLHLGELCGRESAALVENQV